VTERKTVSRAELADLAAGLRQLLDAIEAGELSAGSGTVARVPGLPSRRGRQDDHPAQTCSLGGAPDPSSTTSDTP
jgi:hypothetical protein